VQSAYDEERTGDVEELEHEGGVLGEPFGLVFHVYLAQQRDPLVDGSAI
jgi:hypothetical protein